MTAPRVVVTSGSPEPQNDAEGLPSFTLTPEIEAGLLALAPLFEMVQARRRGKKVVRTPRAAALPARPEMTEAERENIRRTLRRKGYR